MTARFHIEIPREEMLRWYRGEATRVMVRSESGLRIQLPARVFQPFVTAEGVRGWFELSYTERGKMKGLRRLGGRVA